MAKATYQNIRKLCSSVFSRKQTLKFAPATIASCDASIIVPSANYASIQLLFSGDSTSIRAQAVETRSVYCLQPMSVGKMNTEYFKSLNYEVQNYEFFTTVIVGGQPTKHKNPSYLARWPLGLMTMSVVGGQMNNVQPSCVVGQPLKQLPMNRMVTKKRREVVLLSAFVYYMTLHPYF